VIARVHLIQRAIVIGFSLKELASLLKRRDSGDPPCRNVRALVAARLETLEERLHQLEALRNGMRVLLDDWDARLSVTSAGQRARLLDMLEGRTVFDPSRARVSTAPGPSVSAREARSPSTLHTLFLDAFNRHDADGVTALYESDAVLLTQSGPVGGHEAIREFYRIAFDSRPILTLETVAEQRVGALAMLQGQWRWTSRATGRRRAQNEGRSVELVRVQTDGRWLYVIDSPSACGSR
jgi:uncharacterized protein (TIGR02246 family)